MHDGERERVVGADDRRSASAADDHRDAGDRGGLGAAFVDRDVGPVDRLVHEDAIGDTREVGERGQTELSQRFQQLDRGAEVPLWQNQVNLPWLQPGAHPGQSGRVEQRARAGTMMSMLRSLSA